jgi:DNA-binding Lrp family transcriptional regulator
MTDAYVHAIVEPTAMSQAAERIQESSVTEQVHLVTGEYDLVVRLNLESKDDVARAVTQEIHTVSGVVDTVTSVAYEP